MASGHLLTETYSARGVQLADEKLDEYLTSLGMEAMKAKAVALKVMKPMEAKPAKAAGDEPAMKATPIKWQ